MKKLLLVLSLVISIGSVAANSHLTVSETQRNLDIQLLKKPTTEFGLLNIKRVVKPRPPTCKPISDNCISCNGVTYCVWE